MARPRRRALRRARPARAPAAAAVRRRADIKFPGSRVGSTAWRSTGLPRRFLVAANEVNYGKPLYLNTAEALAAALRIAGLARDAELLLAPFASGGAFFALNADAFEAYAAAVDGDGVAAAEARFLADCEAARAEARAARAAGGGYLADGDLPPAAESDDEGDDEEADDEEADAEPPPPPPPDVSGLVLS